jgi:hypothetical protein
VIIDPAHDIAGSIDVIHDATERFPHLLQIWRISV